jgi:hypothetical protein
MRRDEKNVNFVSTGDPVKDAQVVRGIELHQERLDRGCCPNGCGALVLSDPYNAECPRCGFLFSSGLPIKIPVSA